MKRRYIVAFCIFLISAGQLFGHALWIRTGTTGQIGKAQQVKIVYSEPNETPEKLADWYSDVKDFELWLTTPGGKKTRLPVVAGDDQFTAEFTPAENGVYTLSISKSAKDLGGSTVYQFNATALVKVGAPKGNPGKPVADIGLMVDPREKLEVNKNMGITGFWKGQPAEKLHVNVAAPTGWSKSVVTDEKGIARIVPLWPGTYQLEVSKSEKTEGEHHGKKYTAIWRAATLLVEVE